MAVNSKHQTLINIPCLPPETALKRSVVLLSNTMDTHDVSDSQQFMQLLLKQKQNLRDAQSRKGQRPRGRKSREDLIMQFRIRLMMKHNRVDTNSSLRSSFIPPAYSPCISPFCDLTKVLINDLLVETHHRGTSLFLRSITPPDRMNAVMAIVEDENEDVLMLQLYYQEEENKCATEEILGEGTILIVKEPYLKLMSDEDYGIRVDHLSDVIYLPMHDQRVPSRWQPRFTDYDMSVQAWKTKGNEYFNASKYHFAIDW